METMNKCYCSAECFNDIELFINSMNYTELISYDISCPNTAFISCSFSFITPLSKKEIISKLKKIPDTHRMQETLEVHECIFA